MDSLITGEHDFESWAKESYAIATKIAYSNDKRIGMSKAGAMDCARWSQRLPCFPVGYVVSGRQIADRRMILAGYRLVGPLMRLLGN